MTQFQRDDWRAFCAALMLTIGLTSVSRSARAQDEAPVPPPDSTVATSAKGHDESYPNTFEGEFRPGKGFDIIKTEKGSLNISAYGLFRYLDQTPASQTFTDHLGRVRDVKTRQDMNWHRTFVWLTGFLYDPKFRYSINLWSLPTTQQTLLFGTLQYRMDPALNFGVGIGPNLTSRSTQGSWPYWAAPDRQMAEEFFRGGFSSGAWITGMPVRRLSYTVSVNTNISQLGVVAANDSRDMAYSGSLVWMPTTGEFGPRGGLGDLEHHTELATRLGASACHSRESRYAPGSAPPNAAQIRLSDGVFPFEADALAPGVTVDKLDYDYYSADFGAKLKGFSFQGEGYYRNLSNFWATGPVPQASIKDRGYMVQGMHMVIPRTLGLYLTYGAVNDAFKRNPWELSGGSDFYPYKSRVWRLNAHVIHIEKSPTASSFGYYAAGQTGTTFSLATDVLF